MKNIDRLDGRFGDGAPLAAAAPELAPERGRPPNKVLHNTLDQSVGRARE